ncbi:MAG: hypothetical protein GQ569_00020 [Methylococcaceae bacterium]|nr:hypothetical protein [Methylococcaceae bacterium]
MQVQRSIQTLNSPHWVIDLPESFAHQKVEILVITLDDKVETKKKYRTSPPEFLGRVTELGDVMSSVSADDWGQGE